MDNANLSLILPVLGKLLYKYPDDEFLGTIKEAGLFEQIPYECGNAQFSKGEKLLAQWQSENSSDYSKEISDYQDLFVGVRGKVKTPAWESIYVSPDPMMFGECTLNVRLWYDKYGMEIKNIRHEPDDHMGIELMFLAHLMADSPEDAEMFFREHIMLWYERFFTSMAANAVSPLYKGLAFLLYALCADIEKKLTAKV